MVGNVLNIKVCSPLKLRSGLKGNYHVTCHYSYNLPLCAIHPIPEVLTSQAIGCENEKYRVFLKCI